MQFFKYISLLLFSLSTLNCSGLKKPLTNFRAHYNTYYNAEQSFRAGVKQVKKQPVTINPEEPVRAHPEPIRAGEQEFQNAIDKGADLLRRFPDSKWADDALFLMGKSYYFRTEFYLAEQKFEELFNLTSSPLLKQKAVIWKGRALLDTDLYGEGISYLESKLAALDSIWTSALKAEARVVLAEHQAMLGSWEAAANNLGQAISNVDNRALKARTHFLYGQILERLERYGEAYFSYSNVAPNFPDYEYVYWAGLKQAEVARKEGNLDQAIAIYSSMKRDDKNFERRYTIDYEIARTEEMKGNYRKSERMYDRILASDQNTIPPEVRANVYYRIGKIYSEQYQDFETAAAYFDSSSTESRSLQEQEIGVDVETLASAFDQYTTLKRKMGRLDSLLWLGSLNASQLDSVLAIVREQKLEELSEEGAAGNDNQFTNVNEAVPDSQLNASSTVYGFLNHRNPRRAADSRSQFRAVWGNRPLVDDWRRAEVVRRLSRRKRTVREEKKADPASSTYVDSRLNIDVTEIPTTEAEKKETTRQLAATRYELGNLFLVSLNLPDSAANYFQQVIREQPKSGLQAKSMYSLFELYKLGENADKSNYWGQRIMREYPNSRYAARVSERLAGARQVEVSPDPRDVLIDKIGSLELEMELEMEDSAGTRESLQRAERFRKLALANRSSALAPHIYYRAVREYIQLAKDSTNTEQYTRFWRDGTGRPSDRIDASAGMRSDADSLRFGGADSSGTGTSVMTPAEPENPFSGVYWDRVRTVISEYDTLFADHPYREEIMAIKEVLEETEDKEEEEKIATCRELNITPEVDPDMETFLQGVVLPRSVRNMKLSGKLTYTMRIAKDGSVVSYELASENTQLGIEEAYEKAFKESLQFYPLAPEGDYLEAQCEMTFPIKN